MPVIPNYTLDYQLSKELKIFCILKNPKHSRFYK